MGAKADIAEVADILDIVYHFLFWIYQIFNAIGFGSAFDGITDRFVEKGLM